MVKKINTQLVKLIKYYSLINYNLIYDKQSINRYKFTDNISIKGPKAKELLLLRDSIGKVKNCKILKHCCLVTIELNFYNTPNRLETHKPTNPPTTQGITCYYSSEDDFPELLLTLAPDNVLPLLASDYVSCSRWGECVIKFQVSAAAALAVGVLSLTFYYFRDY